MFTKTFKIIRRNITTLIKDIYYFPFDLVDSLLGKRDEFTPPRKLMFVGDGDFKMWGKEFFKYFVQLGGMKPEHHVLDVGCGVGRMAIPLTKYLIQGRYEGFDIIDRGIIWCNETISPKYPNFHFQKADVYNEWYNPSGKYKASDYTFPYESHSFDFVYLTSVFTHLLPNDMENYIREISRVLKPNGRLLITFFIISEEAKTLICQKKSKFNFKKDGEYHWIISSKKPEAAIGFEEDYLRTQLQKSNISIIEPIQYGSWSGRNDYLSFQDIVIAQKL